MRLACALSLLSLTAGWNSLASAANAPPCADHSAAGARVAVRAAAARAWRGAEHRDGLVSKITDYGCFVKIGGAEQSLGLVHVSTLSDERIDADEVMDFVEECTGPPGSKVRVIVTSLEYKGQPRVSLKLVEVITKQELQDIVFAPGPRRAKNFAEADGGGGDDGDERARARRRKIFFTHATRANAEPEDETTGY